MTMTSISAKTQCHYCKQESFVIDTAINASRTVLCYRCAETLHPEACNLIMEAWLENYPIQPDPYNVDYWFERAFEGESESETTS